MKIRSGFVSNSSSSSFIMRAVKFEKEELIQQLGFTEDELNECEDDDYEFMEMVEDKFKSIDVKLSVKGTGNYFGEMNYSTLIVGRNMGELPDGEVVEIGDPTEDEEISAALQKFGLTGS